MIAFAWETAKSEDTDERQTAMRPRQDSNQQSQQTKARRL